MAKYVLTVTLNPAIDKMVTVKNFCVGRDFRESGITLSAGGKGLNVSRALKSLGKKSAATGFLGGAAGEYIKRQLTKEGIENDFFKIDGETRTNLTVIDGVHHKITRILERGPRIGAKEAAGFKKKFAGLLKNCSHVVFSGSIAPGLPESIYAELIALAKKKNVKTILDTSGKPLGLGLKAKPYLIKPNLQEAEAVLKKRLNSFSDMKKALKYFLKRGIEVALISMGERGAVAANDKEMFIATSPRLKCKNNVGCGDALLGGFIVAQEKSGDLKSCIRFAVACGAANALSLQPGFIAKDAVVKMIHRIRVSAL